MAQKPALFYHEGKSIDYTPSSNVTAGDIVLVGTIPMFATQDIAAGVKGSLRADCVVKVPKTSDTFTAGDAVYWDVDGDPVGGTSGTGAADSSSATGNLMGYAVADAATGDEYVVVHMFAAKRTATIAGSVTADDITGSDSSLGIDGLAAAQGGVVAIKGGTSSTGGNAGGVASLTGGTGGAAGAGGAVSVVGGVPASGNAAGGAGTFSGGAGSGTGAGGAVTTKGGASGAGATGNGGAWSGGGGAAASTNGTGGAASLTGGAATGTGTGGALTLAGGASAGASGTGGSVTIKAGAPTGGTAGSVTIGEASNGKLLLVGLPTSDPTVANQVYSDSGTLKLSAG